MAKTAAFHAKDSKVHHNNTSCTEGNNIESRNRIAGTGGKRLCSHCARL
jgi:hypothetical protein